MAKGYEEFLIKLMGKELANFKNKCNKSNLECTLCVEERNMQMLNQSQDGFNNIS